MPSTSTGCADEEEPTPATVAIPGLPAALAGLPIGDLQQMHAQMPYPIILMRLLYAFKGIDIPHVQDNSVCSNDTDNHVDALTPIPAPPLLDFSELTPFLAFIRSRMWAPLDSDNPEDNFKEAIDHARLLCTPHRLDTLFIKVLNDPVFSKPAMTVASIVDARAVANPTDDNVTAADIVARAINIGGLVCSRLDNNNNSSSITSSRNGTNSILPPSAVSALPAAQALHVFDVFAAALRCFVLWSQGGNGALPLQSDLPDMASGTKPYIALKSVYKAQAERDASRFRECLDAVVAAVLANVNNSAPAATANAPMPDVTNVSTSVDSMTDDENTSSISPADAGVYLGYNDFDGFLTLAGTCWGVSDPENNITGDPIRHFLAHCKDLRVSESRSIAQEHFPASSHSLPDLAQASLSLDSVDASLVHSSGLRTHVEDQDDDGLADELPRNAQWYLAQRAALLFRDSLDDAAAATPRGRLPGGSIPVLPGGQKLTAKLADAQWMQDAQVTSRFHRELHLAYFGDAMPFDSHQGAKCAEELARTGCEEIHVTSAVLGGMAADATLKFILGQYTAANNTIVYNGIHGIGSVFEV